MALFACLEQRGALAPCGAISAVQLVHIRGTLAQHQLGYFYVIVIADLKKSSFVLAQLACFCAHPRVALVERKRQGKLTQLDPFCNDPVGSFETSEYVPIKASRFEFTLTEGRIELCGYLLASAAKSQDIRHI